jgi:DNA invertase Pin-like site-specific DNA recombinase
MVSTNGHGSESERVALYMRVSSEEQKTKESIETQAGFLEEYCKLYGYDVAGVYKDEAISGTVPMRERPEGSRLLADAREGTLDAVLVYRLDRIGRSLLVVVDAHDRLGEAGVALKSANEPIDTSSPSGRLIFQMLASFAEFERATIAERSRDGLHRAFKNGKQLGRIPYGYDIAEDGTFVVVEEEASVVRRIIANIARGSTLYAEAKRLNDEGEPSPGTKCRGRPRKFGTTWCHSTIRGIVLQRADSGTHVVNSSRGPIERSVPAIVDLDVYQRAAGRMAENKRYGVEGSTATTCCGASCRVIIAPRRMSATPRCPQQAFAITTTPAERRRPPPSRWPRASTAPRSRPRGWRNSSGPTCGLSSKIPERSFSVSESSSQRIRRGRTSKPVTRL